MKGHITPNDMITYTLPGWSHQTFTAKVKPVAKGGNVRISQIQNPGGAFDGLFGDSVTYVTEDNGNLRFIIGENVMNGDRYTGDFILHIVIK